MKFIYITQKAYTPSVMATTIKSRHRTVLCHQLGDEKIWRKGKDGGYKRKEKQKLDQQVKLQIAQRNA